jgi:hypothetical protein
LGLKGQGLKGLGECNCKWAAVGWEGQPTPSLHACLARGPRVGCLVNAGLSQPPPSPSTLPSRPCTHPPPGSPSPRERPDRPVCERPRAGGGLPVASPAPHPWSPRGMDQRGTGPRSVHRWALAALGRVPGPRRVAGGRGGWRGGRPGGGGPRVSGFPPPPHCTPLGGRCTPCEGVQRVVQCAQPPYWSVWVQLLELGGGAICGRGCGWV